MIRQFNCLIPEVRVFMLLQDYLEKIYTEFCLAVGACCMIEDITRYRESSKDHLQSVAS